MGNMIAQRMASKASQAKLEEYLHSALCLHGPLPTVKALFNYTGIPYPESKARGVRASLKKENKYLWTVLGDLRDIGRLSAYDYARIEMEASNGEYGFSPNSLVQEFGRESLKAMRNCVPKLNEIPILKEESSAAAKR